MNFVNPQLDFIFKQLFGSEGQLWTSEERRAYLKSLDALHKNKRLQEGIFEEGIEKGIEQGIEKGVLQEKEQVAIKLLKRQMPLDDVVELSGLSYEQIKTLKSKL